MTFEGEPGTFVVLPENKDGVIVSGRSKDIVVKPVHIVDLLGMGVETSDHGLIVGISDDPETDGEIGSSGDDG